eukprot:TRINITY_DN12404_c0_g2_i1.p1 TRINITY_DN12404_c0_g2~~TRINITY_DN12404_c0_g2_i1.p1  ORF type:complete len:414 (+),score=59.72 TRINITY_DN12404_c0_g2_i1:25-1266(+)
MAAQAMLPVTFPLVSAKNGTAGSHMSKDLAVAALEPTSVKKSSTFSLSALNKKKLAGRPLPNSFIPQWRRNRAEQHKVSSSLKRGVRCEAASTSSQDGQMTVAITGATGFVGTRLVERLSVGKHKVKILTRSASKARSQFPAGKFPLVEIVEPYLWSAAIAGCTGVVNLAGTPISTRWTPDVMKEIKSSRVETTRKIVAAINAAPESKRPGVFVSSSAVGFYGVSDSATFVEGSPNGRDFLSEVCRDWESAAKGIEGSSTRLAIIRIGIVLDQGGGVIAKMLPAFQMFAGGPIGSGRQWFSWVHREDLVSLFLEALRNPQYSGAINGTAPNPVRMGEMCERLGQTIGRPSWLPVPEFAVAALLGEGATLVVNGQKVLPEAATNLGFRFKYPTIDRALAAIDTSSGALSPSFRF